MLLTYGYYQFFNVFFFLGKFDFSHIFVFFVFAQLRSIDWIDWCSVKTMHENPRTNWNPSKCYSLGVSMSGSPDEIHRYLPKRYLFQIFLDFWFFIKQYSIYSLFRFKRFEVIRSSQINGTIWNNIFTLCHNYSSWYVNLLFKSLSNRIDCFYFFI